MPEWWHKGLSNSKKRRHITWRTDDRFKTASEIRLSWHVAVREQSPMLLTMVQNQRRNASKVTNYWYCWMGAKLHRHIGRSVIKAKTGENRRLD